MLIIISQEILKAIRKTFGPITNLPPYVFPKITRITDYELWQCQTVYGDVQKYIASLKHTAVAYEEGKETLRKTSKGLHNKKRKNT